MEGNRGTGPKGQSSLPSLRPSSLGPTTTRSLGWSLISCSSCCQAQCLWLHSMAGNPDLIHKICTGHVYTTLPTSPLCPILLGDWRLYLAQRRVTVNGQDSSRSLYSSYNYCCPKNNLCSKPLYNMSIFSRVKRQALKWYRYNLLLYLLIYLSIHPSIYLGPQ